MRRARHRRILLGLARARTRTRALIQELTRALTLALVLVATGPALPLASAQAFASEPESRSDAPPAATDAPPGTLRFVGRNLIARARGVFHRWRIREHRIDPARLEEAFALVEVDLASVDTGIERRDTHLRHPDFFGVETHPHATVRVHSARQAGTSAEGHPLYEASFDVDLHDVKKTLQGEIELVAGTEPDAAELVFEGRLTIDRTEFGIGPSPSRWNPLSVAPEIPISFRVVFPVGAQSAQADSGS